MEASTDHRSPITRVTSVFRRGVAASVDGVGVGLHLVAQLAAALHGRVWVDDRPGGGARFCVILPLPS